MSLWKVTNGNLINIRINITQATFFSHKTKQLDRRIIPLSKSTCLEILKTPIICHEAKKEYNENLKYLELEKENTYCKTKGIRLKL